MSIVLVVIGLIVGGVLVGQDLIRAAGVRAQISQIEKYNTATNTFREKYGYLPGDIPNPVAPQFGFTSRGSYPGQGDGNGIIDGIWCVAATGCFARNSVSGGEQSMFWVDLSTAKLIDSSFNTATPTTVPNLFSGSTIDKYVPQAKIGRGNYIHIWEGGMSSTAFLSCYSIAANGTNYYSLSTIAYVTTSALPLSSTGLTVKEAYDIDTKMDDGLPQSGRVIAMYDNGGGGGTWISWAEGGGTVTSSNGSNACGAAPGVAATPSSTTWVPRHL